MARSRGRRWASGGLVGAIALLGLMLGLAPIGASAAGHDARPHHRPRTAPAARAGTPAAPAARAAPAAIGSWGSGSWCWFGDPRAVYVAGQYDEVFLGWITRSGQIVVAAYDPRFGVRRRYVVGHDLRDDHSSPSILVEPDDRLTVFWSAHNGARMLYRTTLRPEDISAWGPVQHVPHNVGAGHLGFTYANPVLLPAEGNRLYLFWRGDNWSADYATRTLGGRWSRAHEMIGVPGQRPYVKVASDGRSQIAFAFTNGHPRNVLTSVFYADYHAGWLWTAGGRRIARMGSRTISPEQADLVYDARRTHVPAWVWDVAFDAHHHPVILYATFPSTQHHQYWYARWTGRRWVSYHLTDGGATISPTTIEYEYSGGLTLDHSNPSIVYLSKQVADGWEIERWSTPDGGAHWHHTVVVPADGTQNVRPIVPRGYDHGPMSLLWLRGHYNSYTDFFTSVDYLR